MMADDVKAGRLVRVLPRYGLPGGGLYIVWPSRALVPARLLDRPVDQRAERVLPVALSRGPVDTARQLRVRESKIA